MPEHSRPRSLRSTVPTELVTPRAGGGPAIWAAFALLGALLASYLGLMVVRSSWQFSPLLDGWLVVGFQSAACTMCIASGFGMRRHRRVAFAMGAACVSWTIGDLIYTVESLGAVTPPAFSVADPFFFLFYPLAFVAIVWFVRGEITREDAPNWLDGVIAALGMAALCFSFALNGIEHQLKSSSLASLVNLAIPTYDVALLGIVVGSTIFVSGRRRATLVLIAMGIALNATGDTIFFIQPASGASHFSDVVNSLAWPTSIWLFAMAMWVAERGSERLALQRLSGFSLPGVLAASSLGLLILDNWRHVPPPAVALAGATLVLAGVRLAFRPALRYARAQLRSSEERYRLLFEQNPLPMVTYDRATRQIVAASNAMVASYGYSAAELHAMTTDQLQAGDAAPSQAIDPPAGREAVARSGAQPVQAMRHKHKDGTIIEVEVSCDDVSLDGRECTIALYIDVTERNRMAAEAAAAHDRAVEASNTKSAFLANMSHEIRTPMNAVIGMTELLLDMGLTTEQRECAAQVARSGDQMLALINDILDISKIETGHTELDIDNFGLVETIEQACTVASALATTKQLHLELEIADSVPQRARGDGRRLHQVLANLLSNAIKFTPSGTVSVRVSARPVADAAVAIHVEVSDSGIGIDPDQLHRMFEPFTQADVSTTRVYGGTGLGLAIASEIVALMGGTIDATSSPGHGSTFWFDVELAHAARKGSESTDAAPHPTPPPWSTPPRVLVAEDSPVNQIVAARALERCGCSGDVVGNGVEALEALGTRSYAAVLMDCQMPEMDGYEAAKELRRREQGQRRTPIIAMTAHAMTGDRERCLEAGMDDYITKPVRHSDLEAALRHWIPAQPQAPVDTVDADPATRTAA
jgi:PAS domain S-box-containing protein